MTTSIGLLPSPAVSDCDSLAGIEDLDAYLELQGPLSILPTPTALRNHPITSVPHNGETKVFSSSSSPLTPPSPLRPTLSPRADLRRNAAAYAFAFVDALCPDKRHSSAELLDTIITLIVELPLPLEVLAMAYMILNDYGCSSSSSLCNGTGIIGHELWVLASLTLADTYNNDRPWTAQTWLKALRKPVATMHKLNLTTTSLLRSLDWSLHRYSDPAAIELSMAILADLTVVSRSSTKHNQSHQGLSRWSDGAACWAHGQLTPSDSPPLVVVPPT